MLHRLKSKAAVTAVFLAFALLSAPALATNQVWVFAAASTQPVMEKLKPVMEQRRAGLGVSYAGSSTLARQIELGAGADVYVSANVKWMDYLDNRGLVEPGTRTTVATNRLAVITGPGARSKDSLMAALGDGRFAIADPAHVPAGLYGREALENLGLWDTLKDRLAPTKDVTGALMLVTRGEAPAGLVYTSDVMRAGNIESIEILPVTSHTPIVYQAAIVKGHKTAHAEAFLRMLAGPEGQRAFATAGFGGAPE